MADEGTTPTNSTNRYTVDGHTGFDSCKGCDYNEDKTMTATDKLKDFLSSSAHRKPVHVLILEDSFYDEVINEGLNEYTLRFKLPNTCTFFYGRLLVKLSDVMPTAKNLPHEIQAFALTNEEFGEMFPDYKNN